MPSRDATKNSHVLSQRERSVLRLIAEGYRNKGIADELRISENTVREARTNLMRKLNAPNISSIIRFALEREVINLYEVLESRFSKRNPEAR